MNKIARQVKPSNMPKIMKNHQERRLTWAEEYMKIDFMNAIFTDKC